MACLELTLLGPFGALFEGEPITAFESNKVRALLAYLAVEAGQAQRREALAALLWPDWPQRSAMNNLSYALSDLRKNIRDREAQPPFLLITRETIQLNKESDVWVDAAEFEQSVISMGERSSPQHSAISVLPNEIRAKSPERSSSEIENLKSAIDLFRGPFLEGFSLADSAPFEEWLSVTRERFNRQMAQALHRLAQFYEQSAEYDRALTYAYRQVALEPWNEQAHQHIMRLLALSGQRSAALEQYETCRRRLHSELGVEPGAETVRLYQAIRDETLGAVVLPKGAGELPPAPGQPPFKGLQYFEEADAPLFFGREALTRRLLDHIRQMAAAYKKGEDQPAGCFLAVVGASGSGKSSVVRAGLVPALKNRAALQGKARPERWQVHMLTPSAHPLEALAVSLTREAESVTAAATLMDDMARDPRSLHLYCQRQASPVLGGDKGEGIGGKRLLLVVDQFEELFTLCRSEEERTAFLDNLLAAANGPEMVVIVLRADFYAHCAQHPGLRQALAARQEYLGPMSAAELRQAIEQPALRNGWEFEAGLVDLILREIGAGEGHPPEPGALPLLEHALLETWRRRSGRTLTLKGYAAAGGVQGAIAQTAESMYSSLSPEQQALARRIFLRLTELGEGVGDGAFPSPDTRRRVALAELTQEAGDALGVEGLLNELADARLVTLAEGTAEVAHEALIREWGRLRQWLSEDREGLRLHRHLTETSQAWDRLSRDPGELYRGARLAQAVEWVAQQGHESELNTLEQDFLHASQEQAGREVADREAQRQRELEAARKLAETQQEAARRLSRRALGLTLALGLAAILLAATLWFAHASGQNARQAGQNLVVAQAAQANAERQAKIAFAGELGAGANASLEKDPELSILLAMQAISVTESASITDTWKYQQVIHDALPKLRLVSTFPHVVTGPWEIAYSPDGKFLAFSDWGSQPGYTILDAASGKHLLYLPGTGEAVAFSPDGKFLATIEPLGYQVWGISTLDQETAPVGDITALRVLALKESGPYHHLQFSPDGQWLATIGNFGQELEIWDVSVLSQPIQASLTFTRPLYTLTLADSQGSILSFSPDGHWLAAGSESNDVILWDPLSGQTIAFPGAGKKIDFSPSGNFLATNLGQVWDIDARRLRFQVVGPAEGWFSVSYNGSMLALGGLDGLITVLDGSTGQRLFDLAGHQSQVLDLAFSPDGRRLASISQDLSIKIWDVTPKDAGELPPIPWGHFMVCGSELVPAEKKRLVTAGFDGSVIIREVPTLEMLDKLVVAGAVANGDIENAISAVALNSQATRLAVAQRGGVTVWDIASHLRLFSVPGVAYPVLMSMWYSADGKYLGIQDTARSIALLDPDTGHRLRTIPNPDSDIRDWVFSWDGRRLAVGDAKGEVSIWDLSGEEQPMRIQAYDRPVQMMIFSPDGKRLLTSSMEALIVKLWETDTGKLLSTIHGTQAGVYWLSTDTDFKYFAALTVEDLLLYDLSSGAELLHFKSPGWNVAMGDPGKRIATLLYDEQIYRLFVIDQAELLALARSRLTRGWRPEECLKYLHRSTCPALP